MSGFALYASFIGIQIIRHWDLQSGSEQQLMLERKTYLVSTILSCLLVFEILGLFLFVYTADHIHPLFVGAMCAAGTLQVNEYGYPALLVKMFTVTLCGVWMILNYTDNKGFDYPLIRQKYQVLLWVTGSLLVETWLQSRYFMEMEPHVITSCCGSLFSTGTQGIAGELASLPPQGTKIAFYLGMALTLGAGVRLLVTGRGAGVFSLLAGGAMVLSLISMISFIAVHYYELPTHHCPFCILQGEYHGIGYPLYVSLFLGGVSGVAVGAIQRLKGPASLAEVIPALQSRLAWVSTAAYLAFVFLATYPLVFSGFVLET
ncbi:MAG: hypothetical protein AB1512_27290 [Thermodesulfobacteriota bacterium]